MMFVGYFIKLKDRNNRSTFIVCHGAKCKEDETRHTHSFKILLQTFCLAYTHLSVIHIKLYT